MRKHLEFSDIDTAENYIEPKSKIAHIQLYRERERDRDTERDTHREYVSLD